MARSEYSIRMDFKRTIEQAKKLEDLSRKLGNVANKDLVNCRGSLSGSWKGENATAYLNKVQIVEGNISSVSKNIWDTAQVVREIAQNTYEAEMRALERARERRYR